ncbi:MAG: hypothetical protein SYC29_06865 [Planctomycetota bacterium]|nr:hypothetical protein [Planctomycetota bacterium]
MISPTARAVLSLTAVCGAAILHGCAPPTSVPAAGQVVDDDRFLILETLPPGEAIAGEDLYPFESGQRVLLRLDDAAAGEEIVFSGRPTDEHDAAFAVALGEARTEFRARNEADDIIMPATIDHDENALTRFDPPLLIAPKTLEPGTPVEAESEMVVVDARNPDQQRERGTAKRTIEYIDDQRIRTPLGEFRAQRIVVHFTADLRLADAENTTTCWLAPDLGIIARLREEEVRILGLISTRKRSVSVLIGTPQQQDSNEDTD